MEGDVGSVNSGGVSESPLSGKLLCERLAETKGGESNNVGGECFEGEEDVGGEIMVEIVGSDVFVDGIGGQKEGLDVCDYGVAEEMDAGFGESVDGEGVAVREVSSKGGLDDGECNPRIEAMVVIGEEKMGKGELVDKDSSESNKRLNHHVEAVGEVDLVTEGGEGLVNGSSDDGVFMVEAENASTDGNCGIKAKIVDEKEVVAAESGDLILKTDSFVSDVCDENQGSLEDKSEPLYEVDVLDLKDGASDINPPGLSCESNDECFKNDVDLLNESIQVADGGDIAEVSKEKGQNTEIYADTEENEASKRTSSCSAQADSDMYEQPLIATSMGGLVKCSGKMETPARDASENMLVEATDARVAYHVACDDSIVNAEVELDIVVEECESSQSTKQITELSNCGVDNLMPNEVTAVGSVSVIHQSSMPPETTENAELHVPTSSISLLDSGDKVNTCGEAEDYPQKSNGFCIVEGHFTETRLMDVDGEGESEVRYDEEIASEIDKFKLSNEETDKSSNLDCALEEVSRRVQLGLACSCIPKDEYSKIETQIVENTGTREESNRYGVDLSSGAASFEPDKLLDYVTNLAPRTSFGADRLDLVIARTQLSAFCCFKGYHSPTEFLLSGELLENDSDEMNGEVVASHKSKYNPTDDSQSRKEKSLTEILREKEYPENESVGEEMGKSVSGRKRKALDPLPDGLDKRVSFHAANSMSQIPPNPSFKVGECIRKVASQVTGSTSLVKGNNDEMLVDGSPMMQEQSEKRSVAVLVESFPMNEMLSRLQQMAQAPKKRHTFQNDIRNFFMGFRSLIALNRRGRKRKGGPTMSGEGFEFDDVNDSYWTDRIVHNGDKGAGDSQVVPFDAGKPVKSGRKPHSRNRASCGNCPPAAAGLDEIAERIKQESSPAELILNFDERKCIPPEINLNKMFRRFGALMESETAVDHESGSAKVIFKRGCDAEVAKSSAEKFNIFGPVLVNYQIGYSPLISVKVMPLAVPQLQENEELMI